MINNIPNYKQEQHAEINHQTENYLLSGKTIKCYDIVVSQTKAEYKECGMPFGLWLMVFTMEGKQWEIAEKTGVSRVQVNNIRNVTAYQDYHAYYKTLTPQQITLQEKRYTHKKPTGQQVRDWSKARKQRSLGAQQKNRYNYAK